MSQQAGTWGLTPVPAFFCAPDGGVDILIPYPEGIDKDNYDFIIGHLITSNVNGAASGTMEFFEPEKTADGLKIHITSASPFIIGWQQAEVLLHRHRVRTPATSPVVLCRYLLSLLF